MRDPFRTLALIFLAFVMYMLPWLDGDGAGLQLGAYDLAEWLSIHPVNRETTPPLLWSMLLRLPPVLLALALILRARDMDERPKVKPFLWIGVVILVLYSLPPLDSLRQYQSDPNIFQQASLSGAVVLLGVAVYVFFKSVPKREWILVALYLMTVFSQWAGMIYARDAMTLFDLKTDFGIGFISFNIVMSLILFDSVRKTKSGSAN